MSIVSTKKSNLRKFNFGEASFHRIVDAYYLVDKDCFEVRFENGTVSPVSNTELKRANKIKSNAAVEAVTIDKELGSGFFVHYLDGQKAEASWEFVLEKLI